MTPVVLTIGALDPLGVDGIAADLRSLAALGVHGAPVVAEIRRSAAPIDVAGVIDQIGAVLRELPVAAVKLGALGSTETAHAVVGKLRGLEAPVIADPSFGSLYPGDAPQDGREGERRADPEAAQRGADARLVAVWREAVLPIAGIITPNLAEAAALTRTNQAANRADMLAQAEALCARGAAHAIVSGGHGMAETSTDIIVSADGAMLEMRADRLERGTMRGLSAVLAAAIAAYVAHGNAPLRAAQMAKLFTSNAIAMADHPGGGTSVRIPHPLGRLWQMARDQNAAHDG
ncbi:MAG TPA: bifunctional hydroxymethylpyrimidine kinase/phosphomethylpyrimidine kinase [Paracoccaceae bacterium]|nr:bifunctional hydroxymethylpyrimidine kinase/phosphomethylpyrimidine kinase [Paracoccaceae bacterium]